MRKYEMFLSVLRKQDRVCDELKYFVLAFCCNCAHATVLHRFSGVKSNPIHSQEKAKMATTKKLIPMQKVRDEAKSDK